MLAQRPDTSRQNPVQPTWQWADYSLRPRPAVDLDRLRRRMRNAQRRANARVAANTATPSPRHPSDELGYLAPQA